MNTCERVFGDVIVLDLNGRLAPTCVDTELWERIRDVSNGGYRKILLNLSRATNSGPFGMSTLLGALLTAFQHGSDVRVLQKGAGDLQFLVGLHDYFAVFETEAEALASFGVGEQRAPDARSLPKAGVVHATA